MARKWFLFGPLQLDVLATLPKRGYLVEEVVDVHFLLTSRTASFSSLKSRQCLLSVELLQQRTVKVENR